MSHVNVFFPTCHPGHLLTLIKPGGHTEVEGPPRGLRIQKRLEYRTRGAIRNLGEPRLSMDEYRIYVHDAT